MPVDDDGVSRQLARRWAWWQPGGGVETEKPAMSCEAVSIAWALRMFDMVVTTEDQAQLYAWVCVRVAELCSVGGAAWAATGYERATVAGILAQELGIERARDLIDAAKAWPS